LKVSAADLTEALAGRFTEQGDIGGGDAVRLRLTASST
jgi:hypothetical protein